MNTNTALAFRSHIAANGDAFALRLLTVDDHTLERMKEVAGDLTMFSDAIDLEMEIRKALPKSGWVETPYPMSVLLDNGVPVTVTVAEGLDNLFVLTALSIEFGGMWKLGTWEHSKTEDGAIYASVSPAFAGEDL